MSGNNAVLARNTDTAPTGVGPYSQTVAFSHYNHLSAQLPIDPAMGEMIDGDASEQAKQCLANIKAVAESIDHSLDDVVRLTVFVTDIADLDAVDDAARALFTDYVPARTNVAVTGLPMNAKVQIEALLSNGVGTIPDAPQAGDLVKLARNTDGAPQDPLATQTVAFSHYNHFSAQLPLTADGQPADGDARAQAAQCLANIKAIAESVDHSLEDVVKINLYLTDPADADAVDQAYSEAFPQGTPARRTVFVGALPGGARVQIEAVLGNAEGTPPIN